MAARWLVGLVALFAEPARAQAPAPPTSCNLLTPDLVLHGAVGASTSVSAVGYTANSDCKWTLQCGAGESVQMSFTDFNMHEWSAPTSFSFRLQSCRLPASPSRARGAHEHPLRAARVAAHGPTPVARSSPQQPF